MAEAPKDKLYLLTTFKSVRGEYFSPAKGETAIYHLDRDDRLLDYYFEVVVDRTQDDDICFSLIRRWDWAVGEVNYEVFRMESDISGEYRFEFWFEPITIEELNISFVIPEFFEPLYLFGPDEEEAVYKQLTWFLAMCGCKPEIYNYLPRPNLPGHRGS